MPGGRLVSATTRTPLGEIRSLGVCIPWADAHVRTGRKDRSRWEDHLQFLDGLASLLAGRPSEATVVAGDFNQRLPRLGQPAHVAEALHQLLGDNLRCVTEGVLVPRDGKALIDHVAHSKDLGATAEPFYGRDLSDHNGVSALIRRRT